ncbi:uncharacterized protein LOC132308745 [Cornus florida]|uniref:uncharacterized protein LOC132308745 n=1 Tax=Cornus florida TaxID=4283 RepID=UPI00289F1D6B|nr:uncharacterized protein LOC132308745 [Cornus florida]
MARCSPFSSSIQWREEREGEEEEEEEEEEERKKMSERPVPRRESPWGISGENHREPKAHRCNDRAEDVVQACFEGNPFKTVPGPFKLFWQCMRSKPGEEPTEPFSYLQLDPPNREVKLE